MRASKYNLLDHVKWLRQAVMTAGAELIIAGDSLQAFIRQDKRHWVLYPQFLTSKDGVTLYTPKVYNETGRFAGWLPYHLKRWPIASDKLAFKRFAKSVGLPVPEFSLEADDSIGDVVVKRAVSSFGLHVTGPFRSASERPLDVAQGEYYERFIEGDLLKVWYWNGDPIAADLDQMAFVAGDGVSSLSDLIVDRARYANDYSDSEQQPMLARCEALLRYYDVDLATVIPKGAKQIVDLRYGAKLTHTRSRQELDLTADADWDWMPVMREAGKKILTAIPEELRAGTLFAVDAVLDSERRVWFLEVNSNPVVHPMVYPAMLSAILATEMQPALVSEQQQSV